MDVRIYFLGLGMFLACKPYVEPRQEVVVSPNSYYLVNEGQFLYGTSSLDIINPMGLSIQNDVYHSEGFVQSNGQGGLGDVFQSIASDKDLLFLVLNNSHTIEVIQKSTLKKVRTISGLESPRYMAIVENRAYVSDLYSNKISVLNLDSLSIDKTIAVSGWTEGIAALPPYVFVCAKAKDSLIVLDGSTANRLQAYAIPHSPNQFLKVQDTLWLWCTGSAERNLKPAIYKIVANTLPELSKQFSSLDTIPFDLSYSTFTKAYYFLNGNKVYQIDLNDEHTPYKEVLDLSSKNIYAMSVVDSLLFCSNAKDFQQRGSVEIYKLHADNNISFIKSLATGIIPQKVYTFD